MFHSRDPAASFDTIRRSDVLSDDNRPRSMKQSHHNELDELETSKTRQCLIKTTKFLFSHIGLVGLAVIYAVAGAFLFQLLEIREDKLNCQEAQGEQLTQITKLKQNIVNYIQNNATPTTTTTTYVNEIDNSTIAFAKIGSMLYDYRNFVIQTSAEYRFSGDNCSIVNKWTFANSLLFAITIITTIGYGNITPVTWEGQLCCVCYATIGIPIFLLCVANISGVLGEMFRFLYGKLICGPCRFIKKRHAQARKEKLEEESGISTDPARPNGWQLENDKRKSLGNKLSNTIEAEEDIDEEELRRNQRVAVPLTVTMIIIAAYIFLGSVLFHNFEGWSMTQAGYFCFITLATIGFGDFVPGQRKDDPNASAKLILGAIYVLFGMAILAMSFDLMQEEIISKFRWIGTKMGIIEKPEENNDQADQIADAKSKQNQFINNPNASINTLRTMINDENGTETPTPRNSSATRKLSPRNNVARIHPMGTSPTNEATLHQRVASTKPY